MALWILLNNVTVGSQNPAAGISQTQVKYAGETINDAVTTLAPIQAAGGVLWPASDPIVAAAALNVITTYKRRGQTVDMNTMPALMLAAALASIANVPGSSPATNTLASQPFKARCVVTSLAAYTGSGTATLTASATGAIGVQDGLTLVAGDTVFIQEGTTNLTAAKDAGLWQVFNPGATGVAYVLTRPWWWTNGQGILQGAIVDISGEGTGTTPTFAGSRWKTFCAKGKVIGTDAPVFWPDAINYNLTLVAGTLAAPITTIPYKAVASTSVSFTRTTLGTPSATIQYGVVPVATPGVTGTSSIVPMAQVGAGTINASDTSALVMSVQNWG